MTPSPHHVERHPEMVTLPQIAKRCGAPYRTLKTWVDRGLVTPTIPHKGTGVAEMYDPAAAARVEWLFRLRQAGLSVDGLERAVRDPLRMAAELLRELEGHRV